MQLKEKQNDRILKFEKNIYKVTKKIIINGLISLINL